MIVNNLIGAIMLTLGVSTNLTPSFNKDAPKKQINTTEQNISVTISNSDASLYKSVTNDYQDYEVTTKYYTISKESTYLYISGTYYINEMHLKTDITTSQSFDVYLYDLFIYQINFYGTTTTSNFTLTNNINITYNIGDYTEYTVNYYNKTALKSRTSIINENLLNMTFQPTDNEYENIYNNIDINNSYAYEDKQDSYDVDDRIQGNNTVQLGSTLNYNTTTNWTQQTAPYFISLNSKYYEIYISDTQATYPTSNFDETITTPTLQSRATIIPVGTNYEYIDVPELMFTVLTMPFTFISTAFNLTLFPNTPYSVNIGNIVTTIVALLILVFIVKIIVMFKSGA